MTKGKTVANKKIALDLTLEVHDDGHIAELPCSLWVSCWMLMNHEHP